MTEHHLTIPAHQLMYLRQGDKHFLVVPERTTVFHYGDVVVLTARDDPGPPLVRWVRYLESGWGYAKDCVCLELAS